MAAILTREPVLAPVGPPERPDLHLLPGGRGRAPTEAVYRRRRAVAFALAVLIALGALTVLWSAAHALAPQSPSAAAAAAVPAAAAGTPVVVLQPGDTAWTIARRLHPTGEIRPLVDRIMAAHGPGPLQPGERIPVPAG